MLPEKTDKPKKKMGFIEKGILDSFISMVLKKAVPSLNKDAAKLANENKAIVLSIQADVSDDGTVTYMPMIAVYEHDKIFCDDSPLMDTNNISKYPDQNRIMIEPIDDVDRISALIQKML